MPHKKVTDERVDALVEHILDEAFDFKGAAGERRRARKFMLYTIDRIIELAAARAKEGGNEEKING